MVSACQLDGPTSAGRAGSGTTHSAVALASSATEVSNSWLRISVVSLGWAQSM
jgi:hypothetical protein